MKQLLSTIQSHLARGTLVFPSEVAAEFWRRAALGDDRQAVRQDRFVSWDTFKEQAFEFRADAVPVNRTLRTVFAERFVRENSGNPLLGELIPREYASEAAGFVPSLVSILPRIPAALTLLRGRGDGRLGRVRSDLHELQDAYSSFMDAHGLFEPRWLSASQHFRGGDFVLVTPELADDFPEFRAAVSALPVFTPAADPGVSLRVFPDIRSELRDVLRRIAKLLDGGADPEQIYLSVAGLDRMVERIAHEAEREDLPLVFRLGQPLGESAPGRFVRAIGEVVDSGFGVAAVEQLVVNAAIPWKDRAASSALVIAGVQAGALGGVQGVDRRWNRVSGPKSREQDAPSRLIKVLRRLLPAVVRAKTLETLRRSFNELLGTLVDRDGWAPEDERILERLQEELRGLAEVERTIDLTVENPYQFWLNRLGETQYVRQSVTTGIAVLPYRVGAATCPEHHFVINATHRETRTVIRSFPFLGDAEREGLESELADRDLSRDFLDVYTASGLNVMMSASRLNFDGSALPAGHFVSSNRIVEDSGSDEPARTATPLTIRGRDEYLRGARAGAANFMRENIGDPEVRKLVLGELTSQTDPDVLRLSPTHVDRFRRCPFSYLLTNGLGLDELVLEIDPEDPALLGMLYHDILAAFFEELAASGQRFEASRLDELRAKLGSIADSFHERRRGMIPDVVYEARRELFDRIADALLANDAALIGGHEPLLAEEWQREAGSGDGFVLVGRVDRVTRGADGRVVLVDYKKSGTPAQKELNAGSADAGMAVEEKRLGSVQIPLYVRLLESAGMEVAGAGYYSLEKGRYLCVFDDRPESPKKCAMTRERLDQIIAVVDDIVAGIASRIRGGDFTCEEQCSRCDFSAVCRGSFHVE